MKLPRPVEPIGSVNVLPEEEGFREIEVCTLLDPELLVADEKFAKAVISLDASRSMIANYGNALGRPNMVQLVARKIGSILATRWSTEFKVALHYWAVGVGGQDVERVGEFDDAEWGNVEISGVNRWGTGTKLLPAIRQIIEDESAGVERTLGVVITDGVIEDETECVEYLTALANSLISQKKNSFCQTRPSWCRRRRRP